LKGIFACKIVNLRDLSEDDTKEAMVEVNIMKELNHPNIIKFEEMIHDERKMLLYIIMEYANGKNSVPSNYCA
jgi:NIMA (never in mitosis gene a)-related kinase